jgi:orotidine-5'-phosphate decarboxylase
MGEISMINQKGIIFAADILQKNKLLSIIDKVAPFVEAIKIGNMVLLEYGWHIIEEIKKNTKISIIVDLKLMDIPYVAEILSRRALDKGADGIMVCGTAGGDSISICKSIFKDKLVFIFTQFTHFTGLITEKMANEYIELAVSLKCDGIQVPASIPGRVKKVKRLVGDKLIIISCGIGEQGPLIGSAIADGADYEIIGRTIYNAKEPSEAAMLAKYEITNVMKEYYGLNKRLYMRL